MLENEIPTWSSNDPHARGKNFPTRSVIGIALQYSLLNVQKMPAAMLFEQTNLQRIFYNEYSGRNTFATEVFSPKKRASMQCLFAKRSEPMKHSTKAQINAKTSQSKRILTPTPLFP